MIWYVLFIGYGEYLLLSSALLQRILECSDNVGKFMGLVIFATLMAMAACIAYLVAVLVAGLIGSFLPRKDKPNTPLKLGALKEDSVTGGALFLGTGIIGQTAYYRFYTQAENGGFKPGRLTKDYSVTIFEVDETPTFTSVDEAFTYPICNLFASVLLIAERRYEFRIPVGSMRHEYNVG